MLGGRVLSLIALRAARLAPPGGGALLGVPGTLGGLRRIVPGPGGPRRLRVGQRCARGARERDVLHLHEPRRVDAEEVLGDHVGHVLQVLARQPELLQLVEREALQLLGAGGHLVGGQVGLQLLEDVLGKRALLQLAGQRPCLAKALHGLVIGRVGAVRPLLEGGEVQVHAQHRIACRAGLRGTVQVVGGGVVVFVVLAW